MLSTCISCRLRLLWTVLWSVLLCRIGLSYVHTHRRTRINVPTTINVQQSTKAAGPMRREGFGRYPRIRTPDWSGRSQGFAGLSASSSYISPIQEAVGSLLGTTSSQEHQQSALIDAAASLTQESCRMLGTKSLGVDYGLARTGIAVTVGFEVRTRKTTSPSRARVEALTRCLPSRNR